MIRAACIHNLVSKALLTIGLLGCSGSAQFTRTASSPYATVPRSPYDVAVIQKGTASSDVGIEIGIVNGDSDAHAMRAGEEGRREVLLELRKVAGQQGCNAIIPDAPDEHLFATSNGTPLYKVYQTARCLVFPATTPTSP